MPRPARAVGGPPARRAGRPSLDADAFGRRVERHPELRSPPATSTRSTSPGGSPPRSPSTRPCSPSGSALAAANPAPFAAVVELPAAGLRLASASPELFLSRQGRRVRSSPIKGTAAPGTRVHRQGPGRERHDRRPRPQRPRAGLRPGLGAGPGAARRGGPPRSRPTSSAPSRASCGPTSAGPSWSTPPSRPGPSPEPRSWPPSTTSPTSSRSGAACTAARSAGSTPTGAPGELNVAIRTFWVEDDHLCLGTGGRHHLGLHRRPASGPRPSSRPPAC